MTYTAYGKCNVINDVYVKFSQNDAKMVLRIKILGHTYHTRFFLGVPEHEKNGEHASSVAKVFCRPKPIYNI